MISSRRVWRSSSAQKPRVSIKIVTLTEVVDELTRNLSRNSGPDLGLSVFEQLHECRYKIATDDLIPNGFR
jgi:hypothetical protein